MTPRDTRRIRGRKPTLLMRHKLLKAISRDKLERLLLDGDVHNRSLSRLDLEYYLLARWSRQMWNSIVVFIADEIEQEGVVGGKRLEACRPQPLRRAAGCR